MKFFGNFPTLLLWLSGLCLLAGAGLLQGQSSVRAQMTPTPTPRSPVALLPPGSGDASLLTLDRLTPGQKPPKLDSRLADLQQAQRAGLLPAALPQAAKASGLRAANGRVQVQLRVQPGTAPAVAAAVAAHRGEVSGQAQADTLLQAWLPPDGLLPLSLRPDVLYLRPPPTVQPLGPIFNAATPGDVRSQALDDSNATAWAQAGWTGQAVRVGVIDAGFQGYSNLLGTELPARVRAASFVDGETAAAVDGKTRHGTAIAEIVRDVAPGADLLLAQVETDVDLEEAVRWLLAQKVDVIVTSVGWYNLSPGDGSGPLAELVAQAEAAGALWVTAAGNDRQSHWGGLFSDPDLDGYHNFSPSQEVNFFGPGGNTTYLIPPGFHLTIHARWDDWTDVEQDFDLLLVRWDGSQWQTIASSRNPQNGGPGQTPTESLSAVTSGEPTAYGFLIRRYRATGAPAHFEIFVPRFFRPSLVVPERSLPNLADAPAALTVAAVDARAPYPLEIYSSEGPTNGPGGQADGGLPKPELAAYTNISTASYGASLFNGTSAAAPHAAGAAALLAGAFPDAAPAQLRRMLAQRAQALDSSASGDEPDTRAGAGRLHLGTPPANLSASRMTASALAAGPGVRASRAVSYELRLVNSGGVTATVALENPLPAGLRVTEQPTISSGVPPLTPTDALRWQGTIAPGGSVVIAYWGTADPPADGPLRLLNVARLSDDEGRRYTLSAGLNPRQIFLPGLEN